MNVFERFPVLDRSLKEPKLRDIVAPVKCYDETNWSTKGTERERAIFLVKDLDVREQIRMMSVCNIWHTIRTKRSDCIHEIVSACLMINKPKSFVRGAKPFLLYDFSAADGAAKTNSMVKSFRSTDDKSQILSKLQDFVKFSGKTERFRDRILHIADEFMMNALYNAPFDGVGGRPNAGLSRDQKVQFADPGQYGRFFAYGNDKKILIGCEDPFGSLTIDKVISSIGKSFDGLNAKNTGNSLGLGLRNVIELVDAMYIAVSPGQYTSIAVSFPASGSLKSIDLRGCNLHFTEVS